VKRPAVSVVIPAQGDTGTLRRCLGSLAQFAPSHCFIYALDDATPDAGIREVCEEMASSLPQLRYVRSGVQRGFVGICNWAYESVREPQSDLLLLSSDAEVTAGFLDEMQAVLHAHERHAVVSARSNNAGLFSIPVAKAEAGLGAAECYLAWQQIKTSLPRYQVMPTAASFCMLIKSEILERFGLFDEAYAPGFYAADDFVCRINRRGYSALAANWAYVFHCEQTVPGSPEAKLRELGLDTLLFRYPEYEREVADYERVHRNPLERFAALYRPHRPRILYDLFHLTPAHTGTSDFGLNLLRELSRIVQDEVELFVGMDSSQQFFANELTGYQMYEDSPKSSLVFDLVFKPCQVISWSEFRRMSRLSPRLSCTILDIIGVRCEYLNSPRRQIVLQRTAELSDCVFTLSDFSRSDFAAFYGTDMPFRVIHLGTNSGITAGEFRRGEYVLVVGNNFAHKGVRDAIEHLNADWPVVVLGGEPESVAANIRWLASGNISRQHMRELFSNARVLIYPSHYEGFGLPVIDALALGKPVMVLDSAVNRELAATLKDANLHRIDSMQALHATVAELFQVEPAPPGHKTRRWSQVAEEYRQAFRELMRRDFNTAKIRARWEALQTLDAAERAETGTAT
jgi:glycosyltransferase involved in cell wall biosynthesis